MSSTLFRKLNLGAQRAVYVFNVPASFEPELAALGPVNVVRDPVSPAPIEFALAFAITRAELDRASRLLAATPGDAVLWFAYPKQSSKRYRCEFDRDSGWDVMRAAGFDSVRMVAIDADWSALRLRRTEYIRAR